jgi:hypothetical protein
MPVLRQTARGAKIVNITDSFPSPLHGYERVRRTAGWRKVTMAVFMVRQRAAVPYTNEDGSSYDTVFRLTIAPEFPGSFVLTS